jgi:hypothetical protein
MSRPISAFLDEVVQFLEEEILPDACTEKRYFDKCETRVAFEAERVKIRFLSHCVRAQDGGTVRVNDVLDEAAIWLGFQFHDDQVTGSWTEALVQCTIGLRIPDVDTPYVLKWEGRGQSGGVLKADERFDHDREYLSEGIGAENAIEMAIQEHLKTTIPSFQDRSEMSKISPRLVQLLFNNDHDILDELDPIEMR